MSPSRLLARSLRAARSRGELPPSAWRGAPVRRGASVPASDPHVAESLARQLHRRRELGVRDLEPGDRREEPIAEAPMARVRPRAGLRQQRPKLGRQLLELLAILLVDRGRASERAMQLLD